MKVLATTRIKHQTRHIIEVTDQELGYMIYGTYTHVDVYDGYEKHLGEHWSRVADALDAKKRLADAAKLLHAVADAVNIVDLDIPITPPPPHPPTP